MGAVVLFDGVCNFCDSSVNFIIRHDRDGYFKFAALQSDEGRRLAAEFGLEPTAEAHAEDGLVPVDSVILIENDQAYTHSTAALRIVRRLSRPWPLLYGLVIVPAFIRDYCYKLFAKYRYRLFGKKDQCMIPTQEVRARFLN